MRRFPPLAWTRSSSASKWPRNRLIGFTGMACSAAPGTMAVFGVEPVSMASTS
jgi:hypothetical protein